MPRGGRMGGGTGVHRTFDVVKLGRTMLWTWGRGRPWGLVWCSKEAMTQCWGLTGENRVRPVLCMNSSTA